MLKVLEVGIEPTLPKELDFESSASTNSATRANQECKSKKIFNYTIKKITNSSRYLKNISKFAAYLKQAPFK